MCMTPPSTSMSTTKPKYRVRKVHTLTEAAVADNSSEDDGYVYQTVSACDTPTKLPHFQVSVGGHNMILMADSGATINLLDKNDLAKMKKPPTLMKSMTKIYPYASDTPLPVIGKFHTTVESKHKRFDSTFYVTSGRSLLNWSTA